MYRTVAAIDVGSRGKRIDRAILAPDVEEHQFRVVVQLQAEPIPPHLLGFQLVGEKLMVHPGGSRDLIGLPSHKQIARRVQACEGNVVRSVP